MEYNFSQADVSVLLAFDKGDGCLLTWVPFVQDYQNLSTIIWN